MKLRQKIGVGSLIAMAVAALGLTIYFAWSSPVLLAFLAVLGFGGWLLTTVVLLDL